MQDEERDREQEWGGVFCGTTGARLDTMTAKQRKAHRESLPEMRVNAQGKLEPVPVALVELDLTGDDDE